MPRWSKVVISYLDLPATNVVTYLLGPLRFFFPDSYVLNQLCSLLHLALLRLAHLDRSLLKSMSRGRCFDWTPPLDGHPLTVQRHVRSMGRSTT